MKIHRTGGTPIPQNNQNHPAIMQRRFFWQFPSAATGAASASNRATTAWMAPTKHATPSAGRNCGGWRGTELISHSCTADRQPREPVGATRNKPAVGPAYNEPGTELWRRVQDKTSSSFASIHARSLLVSPISPVSSAFLMSSISLTVVKPLYKH